MSVAISPSRGSAQGRAEVVFALGDDCGKARVAHLYQSNPLRILFPKSASDELTSAALVTTSGGLVGGDRLDVRIKAEKCALALVHQQAAEKVYRSTGATSEISVTLKAEEQSWLEFLPQETILFDHSKLDRCTTLDIASSAQVMAGEILVFGREAMGETYSHGSLREAWEIRRAGRLVWADRLLVEDAVEEQLADPACFAGSRAVATLIYAGSHADGYLEQAREILEHVPAERFGATSMEGLLILRWLDRDVLRLRASYGAFWASFRNLVAGLPNRLPRLWYI